MKGIQRKISFIYDSKCTKYYEPQLGKFDTCRKTKQNKKNHINKHQFPFLRTGFTKGCSTRFPSITKQIKYSRVHFYKWICCVPDFKCLSQAVAWRCSEKKSCSLRFCKIHRKTPALQSEATTAGACNFIKKKALAKVLSCENCKIFFM